GTIRLDGASLDHWDPDQLGQYVGYLPQDVELLGGTVAEAIAGFDETATDDDVICAARQANAHRMILGLPNGYETEIGRDGNKLSGGQRQRIGLARALFGAAPEGAAGSKAGKPADEAGFRRRFSLGRP
ncbi:ATP-binding cassette domain-containing protein, partial [Bosea sp. CER48]|uniref:ATP-binding cassette domain-containing protein n=1 Tax=Bosea sp. CER48 TaxID=3377035 RepID=UPI003803EF24